MLAYLEGLTSPGWPRSRRTGRFQCHRARI